MGQEQEQEIIAASVVRARALRRRWIALARPERFPAYVKDIHAALPTTYATVNAVLQSVATRVQKTRYFKLTLEEVREGGRLPIAPELWTRPNGQVSLAGIVLQSIDATLAQEDVSHDLKNAHLLAAGIALTLRVARPAGHVTCVEAVLGRSLAREDGTPYVFGPRWRRSEAREPVQAEPAEPAAAMLPVRHAVSGAHVGALTSYVRVPQAHVARAKELLAALEEEDRLCGEQEQRLAKLYAELRELAAE